MACISYGFPVLSSKSLSSRRSTDSIDSEGFGQFCRFLAQICTAISSGRFRKAAFNKLDQSRKDSLVGLLHGRDVLGPNLVTLRHKVDLGPLRQGVLSGVKENVRDQSCVSAITISEWVNLCQSILEPCGRFKDWHRRGGRVPVEKVVTQQPNLFRYEMPVNTDVQRIRAVLPPPLPY